MAAQSLCHRTIIPECAEDRRVAAECVRREHIEERLVVANVQQETQYVCVDDR